uniref:Protein-PII uridylyltransferase N-terminal domain-containing protein n=1 Tax=Branchiostoma floridae TaxID=7739 RepID=C3YWK2_BRAFL|eukprot:XP_002599234.1 hypothetical protein BRAFLDRAFT_64416 [Branchiostoma floridae]
MLRITEKLREADGKAWRIGLVRTETDYLHALLDAMANMDTSVEAEVLKSLGDVNLEKGKLFGDVVKLDMALTLYKVALLRCEDKEIGESLMYRLLYTEKLRTGKPEPKTFSVCSELDTVNKEMPSLASVAERFQRLDQRLTLDHNNDSLVTEYTALMLEGIVIEDNLLELEATKSLGDVYLKRGTENRNTTCLTKATALYNTALAWCEVENKQGRMTLVHRLLYTARIRQDINRTGNKITDHKRKRQQQGHLSRNVPVTSANVNNDVIAGGPCQEFLSPSDFIASQASGKPTPDYRSYNEHLRTGDHALAHGNLDLAEQKIVSALKLIHDYCDRPREAECLYKLGDVYVRRGKATKDGKKFTQAAALYNAALARTDSVKHKEKLKEALQNTEQSFLKYTANVETTSNPIDHTSRHKKRLEDMRTWAKSQLDVIDQQHNPYQHDEDDPIVTKVEAERAEAVKALFKSIAKDRKLVVEDLVDECIDTLGPPPCKYAFIGLGSQATELVTPYSDLEFAILIEDGKDNDVTRRYFLNLTHYLHLKVINLGETILPGMAISSLNDFESEDQEKDWFYDFITPRGFAFDGSMPWASKTPFGRAQTKTKPPVSLIQTPIKMVEFQRLEISLAEGYHLSDILRRVALLAGDETLVQEYTGIMTKMPASYTTPVSMARRIAPKILWEDRENFFSNEPTGELLNVKKDMYRFPGIAMDLIAICCQTKCASSWDVIDELEATERITEEDATQLTVLLSIAAELRLRTYIANGGQQDSLSPLTKLNYQSKVHEVSGTTLKSIFHIPDIKALFRYYCTALPLKKCVIDMVEDVLDVQPKRIFKKPIYDSSHLSRGKIARNLFMLETSIHRLEAALKRAGDEANIERSSILEELGSAWACHSDYNKAIGFFEQSLGIRKLIFGEKMAHPKIVSSLNNLGMSYRALGDMKKAIAYSEQSLTMLKSLYGETTAHPDIANALHNLGSYWLKFGNSHKAINCYEQALTMKTAIYGDKAHTDISATLQNLGSCWCELGDQKKAISYFEKSLTMLNNIYGDTSAHPDIAGALTNLGSSWEKLGDEIKAIGYSEKSLKMYKVIYGEDMAHPGIASSLHNLGSCWRQLGNYIKAISYHEQSITMRRAIYGDSKAHPDIALSLQSLGLSWSDLGDQKKAIIFCKQSLTMWKSIHVDKTKHPNIAMALHNLGTYSMKLGDHNEAISYNKKSLAMRKAIYGEKAPHPDTSSSLNSIGLSSRVLGNHKEAITYFEQALTMNRSIYGVNTAHPDTAQTLANLGSSWGDLGEQKNAIDNFEQSLRMLATIYGTGTAHPAVANVLNSLGSAWSQLGDQTKATGYYKQSLTMEHAFLGDKTPHPDIARSLEYLGSSCCALGDFKKAISYYEQSLSMLKTIYGKNTFHPSIASLLSNLGSSWVQLGNPRKAFGYHEQSLRMLKAIYGDTTAHPDIAASLNNLGLSWSALGDEIKAISHFEKSIGMTKTIYGDSTPHPGLVKSLSSLGSSWSKLGDQRKAISYHEQALMMTKDIYGDKTAHPHIVAHLNNLGLSWGALGDQKKAISYFEQSLMLAKAIYGEDGTHPEITKSLNNLGQSWSRLGDRKKAIIYCEQSLTMKKDIYGHNTAHPDIARSISILGSLWSDLGEHKKAIVYLEQSLEMRKTIYGEKTAHPDIATSLCNLGFSWSHLGDQMKAISYIEQSLQMFTVVYGKKTPHPQIAALLRNLSVVWSKQGNQEKAMEYKERYQRMFLAMYANRTPRT